MLTSIINVSVLICVVLLLHGCGWDPSDIRVLFVPWLLFGLVGDWFARNPIVVPLFGLTVVLATGAYTQSQLHTLPQAPLPTYSGSALARPTRWSVWRDLYVTCALIPVHLIFLTDQSGLSTEQLVSPIVLSIQWLGTFVSLPNWSPCSLAHGLSKIFSLFYRTVYGLSLFCLSYLIYPSCLTSVLFGLYSFGVCCYLLTCISIRTELAW
ncbi:hypothetical protein AHF37_09114 [Paragonimus kellicotti]|nr:hypothetical protein AHF37_09114 [Paragonimus kellicotti]